MHLQERHPLLRRHTHARPHTHTHSRKLVHTHCHAHFGAGLFLFYTITHTRILSFSHAHKHTHTHTDTLKKACAQTRPLAHICACVFLFHTISHTHSLPLTQKHSHLFPPDCFPIFLWGDLWSGRCWRQAITMSSLNSSLSQSGEGGVAASQSLLIAVRSEASCGFTPRPSTPPCGWASPRTALEHRGDHRQRRPLYVSSDRRLLRPSWP